MNDKDFNLKCAEFMGYMSYQDDGELLIFISDGEFAKFNPANDLNDLELLIDKMKIIVGYDFYSKEWCPHQAIHPKPEGHIVPNCDHKNRVEAIRLCIETVLGSEL